MSNLVMAYFNKKPDGFINYEGNKTPVYRDTNGRPYILINIPEGTPGKRTTVKRYIDVGTPTPKIAAQYQNPIYGGNCEKTQTVHQQN